MTKLKWALGRLRAEILWVVPVYFAPLTAAWQARHNRAGYRSWLRATYHRHGVF